MPPVVAASAIPKNQGRRTFDFRSDTQLYGLELYSRSPLTSPIGTTDQILPPSLVSITPQLQVRDDSSAYSTTIPSPASNSPSLGPKVTIIIATVLGTMFGLALLCCLCVFRRTVLYKQQGQSIRAWRKVKALVMSDDGGTSRDKDVDAGSTRRNAMSFVSIYSQTPARSNTGADTRARADAGTGKETDRKKVHFKIDDTRSADAGISRATAGARPLYLPPTSAIAASLTSMITTARPLPMIPTTSKPGSTASSLPSSSCSSHHPGLNMTTASLQILPSPSLYPVPAPGYTAFRSSDIPEPYSSMLNSSVPISTQRHSMASCNSRSTDSTTRDLTIEIGARVAPRSSASSFRSLWERSGGLILRERNEHESRRHVSQYFNTHARPYSYPIYALSYDEDKEEERGEQENEEEEGGEGNEGREVGDAGGNDEAIGSGLNEPIPWPSMASLPAEMVLPPPAPAYFTYNSCSCRH